jgi:cell division protein FtsX
MKRFVVVLLLSVSLSGCAARNTVQTTERIKAVLASDLPADQKAKVTEEIIRREDVRGSNIKEVLFAILSAGVAFLGARSAR